MNSLAYNRSEYGSTNIEMAYDANDEAEMDRYYSVLNATNNFQVNKYCLPYLDHCYASNLPTLSFEYNNNNNNRDVTPPLPLSDPLPPFADIDELNMRQQQQQQHIFSQQQQPPPSNNNYNKSNNDDEVDPYEGSVTRCICDFQHDDGYMICCDRCGVWQHVDCMGVDRKRIPDSYLCELCMPRQVDKRRAVRIQSKKKEQMELEESSGLSGEDSGGEEKRPARRRRNRKDGRKKGDRGRGKQQKRTSSELMVPIDNKVDQKRPKQQHQGSFDNNNSDSDNSAGDGWGMNTALKQARSGDESSMLTSSDCRNSYSPEVLNMLQLKVKSTPVNNTALSVVRQQLLRHPFHVVQYHDDHSKGLEALENIKANQAVVEYTGRTLMRKEYERHCQSNLSYPFTVCYMGINGIELCVDSTKSGNDAKYVRRSCTPNAKVVHILEKTGLRFFICATKAVPMGKEITIPFYFDYHRSSVEVHCHCGKPNCLVSKHFRGLQGAPSPPSSSPVAPPSAPGAGGMGGGVVAGGVSSRPSRQIKKKGHESDASSSPPPPPPTKKKHPSSPQPPAHHQDHPLTEEIKTSSGRVVKPPKNRAGDYHHSEQPTHHPENPSHHPELSSPHPEPSSHPNNSITSTVTSLLKQSSYSSYNNSVSDDIDLLKQLSSSLNVQKPTNESEIVMEKPIGKSEPESFKGNPVLQSESNAETAKGNRNKSSHGKSRGSRVKVVEEEEDDKEDDDDDDEKTRGEGKKDEGDDDDDSDEEKEDDEREDEETENKDVKSVEEEEEDEEDEDEDDRKKKENSDDDKSNKGVSRKKSLKLLAEIQSTLNMDAPDHNKKSREQRKIEEAEKRFEKIEQKSKVVPTPTNKATKTSTRAAKENNNNNRDNTNNNNKESNKVIGNKVVKDNRRDGDDEEERGVRRAPSRSASATAVQKKSPTAKTTTKPISTTTNKKKPSTTTNNNNRSTPPKLQLKTPRKTTTIRSTRSSRK